jgi:hypothetical protein
VHTEPTPSPNGTTNYTMTSVPCDTKTILTLTFGAVDYNMDPSAWMITLDNGCFSSFLPVDYMQGVEHDLTDPRSALQSWPATTRPTARLQPPRLRRRRAV